MFNIFSSAQKNKVIGLEFLPNGVAIVEIFNSGKKAGIISAHAFIESIGQQAQMDALSEWVKQNNADKMRCHCLLSVDDYSLFQIEKPLVDDSEISEAIKWKIKDLVSFDVDHAVIEYFPMPESPKNNTLQINVVAANDAVISAYIDIVKEAGLTMQVMDVGELALKNMVHSSHLESGSFAVLVMNDQMGQIYVFKDGALHVVRDFKVGIKQLDDDASQEAIFDSILLEVQRSVDYFESYYGLGGIAKLYISPQITPLERMANYLQNYVNFDIEFLAIDLVSPENSNIEFDYRCFMSYCVALRA